MKCYICNQSETISGTTSVLLESGSVSLTIKNVPARICRVCGEAYAEEPVAVNLLRLAEKMAKAGAKVDVCEYKI
jgi:YgiT-type zinc finger domain-containing protein